MNLGVVALTFGAIFVVELPDKTFIAALVLSTRYRGLFVWIGVGLAFLVQTLIAVGLGKAVTYLPHEAVYAVAGVIYLIGAVVLARGARHADEDEEETEEKFAAKASARKTGGAAVLASFLVLFAAEWGDLSQLLTVSLVGRYDEPVAVFAGAWGALLAVSAFAVLAGRFLLRHVRLSVIHYVGATACLLLAGITAYDLLRV